MTLSFADTFGYCFRKRLALAIDQDLREFAKADNMPEHSGPRDRASEIKWSGEGSLDQFRAACPVAFTLWMFDREDGKRKVGSTVELWVRRHRWEGLLGDVWLKTPTLTLNRVFPHEINRVEPTVPDEPGLRQTLALMALVGLQDDYFDFLSSHLAQDTAPDVRRRLDLLRACSDPTSL